MDRDRILQLNDNELSAECDLEFYKETGRGGQKRNKTSSAVRVRHKDSGLVATDCSGRCQHANRRQALYKLKLEFAFKFRNDDLLELPRSVCAVGHDDYPLWVARLLDVMESNNYDPKASAQETGHTTSGLVKLIFRDSTLWQLINQRRQERGFSALKH